MCALCWHPCLTFLIAAIARCLSLEREMARVRNSTLPTVLPSATAQLSMQEDVEVPVAVKAPPTSSLGTSPVRSSVTAKSRAPEADIQQTAGQGQEIAILTGKAAAKWAELDLDGNGWLDASEARGLAAWVILSLTLTLTRHRHHGHP